MSSRYPPTASDSRYARDRSPDRYGRRSTEIRASDNPYDRSDSYGGRGGATREPPRGPKAQLGRATFASRGRGFAGRNESYDRDPRDDTFLRGKGRGQDWDGRDRYDVRDRRRSPPSRNRSRSPYREPRETDFNFRQRDSRDGPPLPADVFPHRGRGSYRGRVRGDWDSSRGRTYHNEERSYNSQAPARDRQWDPSRDQAFEHHSRNDDPHFDREKDDRYKSDPVPLRSESRNSYTHSRPIGSMEHGATRDGHSGANAAIAETTNFDRRYHDPESGPSRPPFLRGDRSDSRHQRSEAEWTQSRASSPQAAPAVPAFGSVMPQPAATQEGVSKSLAAKEEEQRIHPSRRPLVESTRESSLDILNAPTAPKAQQKPYFEDVPRSIQTATSPNARSRDLPHMSPSNKRERYPSHLAPAQRHSDQPSVRKALEEEGRNGYTSANPLASGSSNDLSFQTSPMRIPTGPRAGRGGPPSIRQPIQPSIRAPMASRGPSIMGRGRGQASTLSWHSPSYRPAAPRAPSIMKPVATRKEMEAHSERVTSPSVSHLQVAVDQWRQKNNIGQPTSEPAAGEAPSRSQIEQDDQSIMQTSPASPIETDGIEYSYSDGPNEAVEDNDINLGLDDADLQALQTKHDHEMQRLQSRKPPEPSQDPVILQALDELDALAIAIKDSSEATGDNKITGSCQEQIVEVSKRDEAGYNEDLRQEEESMDVELPESPGTPPLESLPFLQQSGSTPFSDIDDVKTPTDEDDLIKNLIQARIQDEEDSKFQAQQQARGLYRHHFKSWRHDVDAIEAAIRDEHAQEASTPPDSAFEATSVPQSVRSRRVVSDYSYQAVLQASVESHAREEQVRREREEHETQHYIPADTYNPDREAVVPPMLEQVEAQETRFIDYVDQIAPEDVLEALRFVPPKDDFTVKEKADFIQQYVQMPKRFGEISENMHYRDYRECVRHYYHSKRTTNFRNAEAKFFKTNKGRKMREQNERNAGIRPRGGLLAAIDSAHLEQEAQNAASLTESGRPRRAAAPTFGEAGEGEVGPTPAPTPSRRPTVGKESMPPAQNLERPVARRGKTGTGQKPGRKPKAQLLAAAPSASQTPSPSPLKDASRNNRQSGSEAISEDPRMDEQEPATLLAKLPISVQPHQIASSYTEPWPGASLPTEKALASQDMSEIAKQSEIPVQSSRPPSQAPTSAPHPKPQHSTEQPTSYWSVPEKQDFLNYVNYFGTDWANIARAMKTKSTQMIKNYYQREIDPKKGTKAIQLQQAASNADDRRHRGEDMGPLPLPTPAQPKRRYDSSTSRENQKPLAPVNLSSLSNDDISSGRPAKTRMSPQDLSSLNPRLSASSQAEQQAAASSAQVLAQGPQSPASRGVIHMQQVPQQRPQPLQHLIPGRTESTKSDTASQAIIVAADKPRQLVAEKPDIIREQQQKSYQRHLEDTRRREETRQLQDHRRQQLEDHRAMQIQLQRAQIASMPSHFTGAKTEITASPHLKARTPQVHIDEESRRVFDQRQEELRRPSQVVHRHSQGSQSSRIQPLASSQGRTLVTQSPTTSASVLQTSTRLEPVRPSSVPAPMLAPPQPSTQPAQPSQPKRTSNIMSLLNEEPEEPKVSKRNSDPRSVMAASESINAERKWDTFSHPSSQPASQSIMRSETPRSTGLPAEFFRSLSQAPQRQMTKTEMENLLEEIRAKTAYTASRPFETSALFTRPGSTLASYAAARERAGIGSPPAQHSRTPSYTGLQSQTQQHQHQHQQHPHQPPPQSQREARQSLTSEAPSSRLRTNPWGTIPAPPSSQTTQERLSLTQQHPTSSYILHPPQRESREELSHRRSLESIDSSLSHPSRHVLLERQPSRSQDMMARHTIDREQPDPRALQRLEAMQHAATAEENKRRAEEYMKSRDFRLQQMQYEELKSRGRREDEQPQLRGFGPDGQR